MQITIDTEQRIFLVKRNGFFTRDYFCNLHHIPEIIRNELEKNDEFEVLEYWNRAFKKLSKKRVNELLQANKIDFKIL